MNKCMISVKSIRNLLNFLLLSFVITSLVSCTSNRIIVNGLDEKEANEILVFLASKNIQATKVQALSEGAGGKAVLWNISVPEAKGTEAMALLNQVGLPRRRGQNLLGIFSNVGLVPSGMEQKVRYQAGLGEQIANTIRKIDGVLDADVQLSFPEEDPLNPGATKQKITASVYVKHSGVLDDPNAHLVTRIKRLVAGSINGLDYDNVTVIGDRARFMDTPSQIMGVNEDKQLVTVWTLLLASESLTRFRVIFFSFIFSIIILFLVLAWMIWKCIHVLQKVGFKSLLNYHSIQLEDLVSKEELSKEKESPKEPTKAAPKDKENASQEEEPIEEGVDET
jgi:type III secretion protein J